jgi:hypothetical protein
MRHGQRERTVSGSGLFIDAEAGWGGILTQGVAQTIDGCLGSMNLLLDQLGVGPIFSR